MPFALLGLGSNLASPSRQLHQALEAIRALPQTQMYAAAPFYKNAAWGKKSLPDYYNTVVLIKTRLTPLALLSHCQKIEAIQQRVRGVRNQARTLDVDILDYDGRRLNHPRLMLPHPRMHEREFVQAPLMHIPLPSAYVLSSNKL